MVITYIDEPGSPQYIAELSDWNFHPRLSDHYFTFRPPVGSNSCHLKNPFSQARLGSRQVFMIAALMVGGVASGIPDLHDQDQVNEPKPRPSRPQITGLCRLSARWHNPLWKSCQQSTTVAGIG